MSLRSGWRWIVGVLILTSAVLALIAYRPAQSLPDGLVPPDGRYDVRILRDTYGVPHIFGQTDPDVAYGLAFAHAEDDFPTIQGALLAARGKLASVYGPDAAPNDYMVALLDIRRIVEQGYPELPQDVKDLCRAYADGLNHYAALHPEQALGELYPVDGSDVVAGFVHKLPLFFGIDRVLKGFVEPEEPPTASTATRGSNAFALAPTKTADGSTILVINSHQPWEGPVAWYEAHLHSESGWNMTGGVFPGAPIILHGHNPHLGWAHTVNKPDLVDEYELVIDAEDPDRYRLDGEWQTLETSEVAIDVKLWGPFHWTFKREILRSVHGPAMRTDHGTFALRFSGFGEVSHVEQWYRMNRAENMEQWIDAMDDLSIPMFNTVYADRAGNIGYVYNAALPKRQTGFDYSERQAGDDSRALWDHGQMLAFDRLPQVWNPESGFVQNCNNTPFFTTTGAENPSADDFAEFHGIESRKTNRSLRAMELLGNDERPSLDRVLEIKFDTTYHPDSHFAALRAQALALPRDRPELSRALEIIEAFDLETDLADLHAALAVKAFADFVEPPSNPTDAQLAEAVLGAADQLRADFGDLETPWGEVNRLRRGDADLPLAGAPDVLHAVYGKNDEDGRLKGWAGDSYVLVVQWPADGGSVQSQSLHQYGSATLDAESEHYADQAPLFAERRLKPAWIEESELRRRLEREYRPGDTHAP